MYIYFGIQGDGNRNYSRMMHRLLPRTIGTFTTYCAVFLASACIGESTDKPASAKNDVITITVLPGERQVFEGFGASVANFNNHYDALPRATRDELSSMVWRDLKFRTLRLWMPVHEYAKTPGAHDLTVFRHQYIDSEIIADALRFGVTTLLLAPDNVPEYMQEKHADGTVWLKPSENAAYAKLLADFIARAKSELGVTINVTGIQNEASDEQKFAPAQIADVVARLRGELDARGLRSVKIIASENASANEIFAAEVDAMKANPKAWQALAGVASHSYNMAATEEISARIAGSHGENLREYWMTEAGDNGHEEPGDIFRAMSVSARFLNDINHRVTHWIHFLAFENVRKEDNATCILTFTNEPPAIIRLLKYDTYKQLSDNFDTGARLRHSHSSLEGEMPWTYGKKSRLTAAVAQNPDGSWAIGLANYTAASFSGVQGWADEKWNREQGGYTPAQAFEVTIEIPELKDHAPVVFTMRRTNATTANAPAGTFTMTNGSLTVPVASMELITLRSTPTPAGGNPPTPRNER